MKLAKMVARKHTVYLNRSLKQLAFYIFCVGQCYTFGGYLCLAILAILVIKSAKYCKYAKI